MRNKSNGMQMSPGYQINMEQLPYVAQIKILEHPQSKFRFRYRSEMPTSHGSLVGETSTKQRKTHITVKVENCHLQSVILKAWLVSADDPMTRHVHELSGPSVDPAEGIYRATLTQDTDMTQMIQGLGIIHEEKRKVSQVLYDRKKEACLLQPIPGEEQMRMRNEAEKDAKSMNLDRVSICFQAFQLDGVTEVTPIAVTKAIHNLKSVKTGDLKITRISKAAGECTGNEEVWILVDKITRSNIGIRFYEEVERHRIWEADATFSQTDVHHQYAIVFKTPPYRDLDINQVVDVKLQLYRPSDGEVSESRSFMYKPRETRLTKRPRDLTAATRSDVKKSRLSEPQPSTSRVIPRGGLLRSMMISPGPGVTIPADNESLTPEIDHLVHEIIEKGYLTEFCPEEEHIDTEPVPQIEPAGGEFNTINIEDLTPVEHYEPQQQQQYQYQPQYWSDYVTDGAVKPDELQKKFITLSVSGRSTENGRAEFTSLQLAEVVAMNTAAGLHRYAKTGNVEELLSCMRHLVAIHSETGDNVLHTAILHRQKHLYTTLIAVVRSLPQNYIINDINSDLQTPLHVSIATNQPEVIAPLLHADANVGLRDINGNTPLHLAAIHSDCDCMRKLLDKKLYKNVNSFPALNESNYEGFTALHLAVQSKVLDNVKILCDAGIDVDIKDGTQGKSALYLATEQESVDIVKYLLEKANADGDVETFCGNTSLHHAASTGNADIVLLLLKAGASPWQRNFDCTEDGDDGELEGFNCVEVAKNDEIRELLRNPVEICKENTVTTNKDKEEDKSTDTGIFSATGSISSGDSNIESLDNITQEKLSKLIDPPSDVWRHLVDLLEMSHMLTIIENKSRSQTQTILNNLETCGLNLGHLRHALEALDQTECVKIIDDAVSK